MSQPSFSLTQESMEATEQVLFNKWIYVFGAVMLIVPGIDTLLMDNNRGYL